MSRCLIRASEPTYKPRSWGGVGKGSHSPIQALVEAPVGCVQIPDERVGFVQGGGGGVSRVQKAGGVVTCPWEAEANLYAPACRLGDTERVDRRVKRHLSPPHPTVA